MKTEILISTDDWENRVAVLEEGALAEIYFEREEKVIGSIYKARVENVLPGMGASFVNIGLGRNAFLYVDDIRRDPISIGEEEMTERRRGHTVGEMLKVGDEILVQIVKEPRGLKGARVSTNISLPGRFLVLMPTGRFSGVSSRIEDDKERERLKQIMRKLRPEGMATVVRTAAAGVSEAELLADLGVQVRLWHTILESYRRVSAPALLHKDLNLVFKTVRDFLTPDVDQVVIDSKEQYEEIRSMMSLIGPQYLNRLKLWEGPGDLFGARGIDEELQKLLKPKIFLPSGGHLVIESTEALTVIDVNTGKFTGGRNLEDTIVRTNIEAAAEIARQVRLRDIGGIIVVDFIDMTHERSREQVIATLSEALRRDRTRSTIQMFSNLGLLEFTRKRVGKDLAGQLRSECPHCGGLGSVMSSETIAIGVLRQIRQNGMEQRNAKSWDLVVEPSVATQLMGWYREEFEKLSKSLDADVRLYVQPQRNREQVVLEPARRERKPLVAGQEVEADLLPVRLPDPSAGVAVVDGWLIDVKDAAAGVGQTVKLKVVAVENNAARAELAEPLAQARRRRRRRGKAAVEAQETAKPLPPAQPARLDRVAVPRNIFGLSEEDEEEDYTLRGRPAGRTRGVTSTTVAKPAARGGRGERADGRGARPGGRGRQGARGRGGLAESRGFKPLVVGGESDIDYDDHDESSVVVVPDRTKPIGSITAGREPRVPRGARESRDLREPREPRESRELREPQELRAPGEVGSEETADGSGRRRRRRRGRGGRKLGEGREGVPAAALDEDDLVVGAVPIEDEESRGPERDERPRERQPRRFSGPIRQLYGAPVEISEEGEARRERPRREDVERRPRADERRRPLGEPERQSRGSRASARPVPEPRREVRDDEGDDLEAVVKPVRAAAIDVEFVPPGAIRHRRPEAEPFEADGDEQRPPRREGQSERAGRGDRGPAGRGARAPSGDRPPSGDRGGRPERSDRGGRGGDRGGRGGRGGRGSREPQAPRVGPAMKQLYPPADMEPEPIDESNGEVRRAPLGKRRPSHGTLFGSPGAAPPPKGKVRQLYPPPPPTFRASEESAANETTEADASFANGPLTHQEPLRDDSLFVSSEEELEERRLRARERAEQRGTVDLDIEE